MRGEYLNEAVIANASGDRDKGTRFARAPTSLEACTFCLMLANPHTPQEMKNAKELAQATNPGFSWRKLIIEPPGAQIGYIFNAAKPPRHLDKHDGQKPPRGNA